MFIDWTGWSGKSLSQVRVSIWQPSAVQQITRRCTQVGNGFFSSASRPLCCLAVGIVEKPFSTPFPPAHLPEPINRCQVPRLELFPNIKKKSRFSSNKYFIWTASKKRTFLDDGTAFQRFLPKRQWAWCCPVSFSDLMRSCTCFATGRKYFLIFWSRYLNSRGRQM